MIKKTSVIIAFFSQILLFAQTDLTPFSSTYSTNKEAAKIEIGNVVNRFNQVISSKDIDWKLVNCDIDNKGYTADVYLLDGKIRKIRMPYFDRGNNGLREFYYRDSGELGMVIDYDHQAYQVNKYYHLLGLNKVWNFFAVEDVSPEMDYVKSLEYIDTSQAKNKEFVLDFAKDSFLDFKNKMRDKANAQILAKKSLVYLKGTIDFKHLLIMRIEFKEQQILTGRYRFQKSKEDIQMKGTWTDDHFELKEYNPDGIIIGKFKGQFINAHTAVGFWHHSKNKKSHYLELKTTTSYTFTPKAIKDNEIDESKAGIFEIGKAFPNNLPTSFTSEVEEKICFEEGIRFVQHIFHVKKDEKLVLNCVIEENAIQEIEIIDGYQTPDHIGVGATIIDFGKTYPDFRLWYTYISDKYVLDSELLGVKIQFLLDKKDFIGKIDFNEDISYLKLSDFKINSKIKKIIIKP